MPFTAESVIVIVPLATSMSLTLIGLPVAAENVSGWSCVVAAAAGTWFTGASLTATGVYDDELLVFNPQAKIVRRLLADYTLATGIRNPKPAISGAGTYAKRLPNSIAFGMWFPDNPYPGHDLDEKNPIADLQKGTRVLIYALTDIATAQRRSVGALVAELDAERVPEQPLASALRVFALVYFRKA